MSKLTLCVIDRTDATLTVAIERLSKYSVEAVLVVEKNSIKGILSERDIVHLFAQGGPAVLDEPVCAAMTREVAVRTPLGHSKHGDGPNDKRPN